MRRLTLLSLVVLALALVPGALAEDAPPGTTATTTTATTTTPARPGHAPKLRLEIIRLRIRLAHLRYRAACRDETSDRCTEYTQKAVERLTKLDEAVQSKLEQCTSDSEKRTCKALAKLDERLQDALAKLNG
jgi:hypothetical protein